MKKQDFDNLLEAVKQAGRIHRGEMPPSRRFEIDSTVKSVAPIKPDFPYGGYSRVISPIPSADGGGFLVTFPDLPGCMSNGPTEAEALANAEDAFLSWVSARADQGKKIPPPR